MARGSTLRHVLLGWLLAGAVLGIAFASISPARADLRVCNETGNAVSIALGYRAERGWQSEGWWVANPNQCATVYQGDLNARFFYLYVADDITGGAWDGQVFMCTRDESFTIFGVEDCLARGYERTGFFEVDTQNRTDWTLQLTEPLDQPEADIPEAAPGEDSALPLEAPDGEGEPTAPGPTGEADPQPDTAAP